MQTKVNHLISVAVLGAGGRAAGFGNLIRHFNHPGKMVAMEFEGQVTVTFTMTAFRQGG